MRRLVLLLVAAVALGGCGDDPGPVSADAPVQTIRNPSPWTDEQIADALNLRKSSSSVIGRDTSPSGCTVFAILNSKEAVDMYSGAGDTVVTNPDGTAGVKAEGDKPECLEEFGRGLRSLRP